MKKLKVKAWVLLWNGKDKINNAEDILLDTIDVDKKSVIKMRRIVWGVRNTKIIRVEIKEI
jgi:hypothetical protein